MNPNSGPNQYNSLPGVPAPRKEPFFSLVASFFIPGLGTILNGETAKGVRFMAAFYLSPLIAIIASFGFGFAVALISGGSPPFNPSVFLLALLVAATAWFWSLIDAYKGAEAHNARNGLH